MAESDNTRVIGDNGLRGYVLGPSNSGSDNIDIELEDGREISVPASSLARQPDGTWYLHESGETVIPVLAEELDITKRVVPTGGVRVVKESIAHDETFSMPLTRERAEVKRVLIGRQVDGPMPVRREGDTIIMPVVEEVPVVEKRLILKEEIHITRRRSTQQHEETVPVHREHATVQRLDESGRPVSDITEEQVVETTPKRPLAPEERSILDPKKPRPSLLGPNPPRTRRNRIVK
jgi:uncharacterized protein (TIGR02271 family)